MTPTVHLEGQYVPALSIGDALCVPERDARVTPAHDAELQARATYSFVTRACRIAARPPRTSLTQRASAAGTSSGLTTFSP